jgi:hypothetical protein
MGRRRATVLFWWGNVLKMAAFETDGDGMINIKTEHRKIHWEGDKTGSSLYPVVGSHMSNVELWGCTTREYLCKNKICIGHSVMAPDPRIRCLICSSQ